MPPKHKVKEDWSTAVDRWVSKAYNCAECHDTGKCKTCQGRGCMTCSYTGVCQHCLDAQHQYLEGLA